MADDEKKTPEQSEKAQDECELADEAAAAVSGGSLGDLLYAIDVATTQIQQDRPTYL